LLDDTLRRGWVAQVAQERADQARTRALARDAHEAAVEPHPFEKSRWLGLQVRSLLALVAVAEEGSFVGAARRLGYSRSTISHQIAQLEVAVGVSLVVRSSGSRSILVTPAGRIVVGHGRAVIRLLAHAESQLAELGSAGRRHPAGPPLWLGPDAPPAPA
jgi:molybdenum-dependent DNA-binding transcriptional regulator ModE